MKILKLLILGVIAMNAQAGPVVEMNTSEGMIEIELNEEKAPISVANFLKYVDAGHYDGTIFHRVIKGFMIQGGGFDPQMQQKPVGQPIKNEADNGLSNVTGSIAMARTNDPHSATAQFFINTVDNGRLDFSNPTPSGWGYTVFGQVTSGLDVVKKIEATATGQKGMHGDVPLEPIVIQSVKRK
ncbi:MAG: peptidyl-prolyl cis-trans isomerase [Gammaproteobacteria bacterium]|nr:peptidyl-prolyl cis-trans isomerase [Gammaproteobacteria bacterium]